jgi:hypothetical protein
VKRLLVLVAGAMGAFLAYHAHQSRQAPVTAFTAYADAVARGRHDLARQLAVGELAGEGQGDRHAVAGWVPVQEIRRISYQVTSRTPLPAGGEEVVEATQTVAFNPPGVESALRAAMTATFRLRATLRSTPEGWKVAAFSSEFLGSSETR